MFLQCEAKSGCKALNNQLSDFCAACAEPKPQRNSKHSCQLSRNVLDTPGFLTIVLMSIVPEFYPESGVVEFHGLMALALSFLME